MSDAMAQAMAEIAGSTRAMFCGSQGIVNQRARRFRADRLRMLGIDQRLPFAVPAQMIAIGAHLVDRASTHPSRLVQIAPVTLVNAKAVLLLGRYERRFGERLQEAA